MAPPREAAPITGNVKRLIVKLSGLRLSASGLASAICMEKQTAITPSSVTIKAST